MKAKSKENFSDVFYIVHSSVSAYMFPLQALGWLRYGTMVEC